MKNPFKKPLKIMTALIKKLRKRKLSSELDPRWGDASISYPNEGSWSQHERPSAATSPVPDPSPEFAQGHQRNRSFDGQSGTSQTTTNLRTSQEVNISVDSSWVIPTGYYDASVGRRYKRKSRLSPESHPALHEHKSVNLPQAWETGDFDSSEDEAECDDVSSLSAGRARWRDENEAYSRASKSPPLSVTSRMRCHSTQSTATDPTFSIPNTASSKRTSFTSSLPDDPRLVRNSPYHDKRPIPQVKVQESAAPPQELVPSYDDLYG